MSLYITLTFILIIVLCFATNRRSQEIGFLLSASQTKNGCIQVYKLNNKTYFYKKWCNLFAFLLLMLMWILTAFRASNIGNDTNNYINYFENINDTGIINQYQIEYGFQLLCLFVGVFTKNPQVFLIVCATICYVGVGFYAYRYSKNILVSLILIFTFCFSIFINTLRQDIAMVICLYAYQAIKDKKNLKALIFIVFAITFHKSAAIYLLLLFYKVFSVKIKVNIALSIILVAISISGVLDSFLSITNLYSGYVQSQYAGTGWIAVAYYVLQSLFFYWFIYRAYNKNLKGKKVVLVNCVLCLFLNLLGFSVNLFTRAAQYFLLPMITEIPNACYDGKVKSKNLWLLSICLVLLSYFLVTLIVRPEWNNLYPYSFFN